MKGLLIVLFLFITPEIFSFNTPDDKRFTGKIVGEDTEPLTGVNVYTTDRSKYTISDENGMFAIDISNSDTVVISMVGLERKYYAGSEVENNKLVIIVLTNNNVLSEIIATPPKALSSNYSTIELDKYSILLNPMADGDALKAITLLPYSTAIDESASPSLRGSSDKRSVVVINGVPVTNPIRNTESDGTGGFSLFSTDIIKTQTVYASNPPVIYGNSTGGTIDIETNDKLENENIQLSTHLAGSGVFLNKQLSAKLMVQLFTNAMYSGLLLKVNPQIPDIKDFKTIDVGTNVAYEINEKNKVKSYIAGYGEKFNSTNRTYAFSDNFFFENKRAFIVNNYRHLGSKGVLNISNLVDFSDNTTEYGILDFTNKQDRYFIGLNYMIQFRSTFSFVTGTDFDYQRNKLKGTAPTLFYDLSKDAPHISVDTAQTLKKLDFFLYAKWDFHPQWGFSAGLRTNVPMDNQEYLLNKQFSFVFTPNKKNSFILGLGDYYNYADFNTYTMSYNLLKSRQISLDYIYSDKKRYISSAVYYKEEKGNTAVFGDYTVVNSPKYKILGIELFYERYLGKYFKLSTGYTFLKNKMYTNGDRYNATNDFPYLVKASLSYNNPKSVNTAITFITRSGQYYTDVIDSRYDNESAMYYPIIGRYNNVRFNSYKNITFNINKIFYIKKHAVVAFITLSNLLDSSNQQQAYYNSDYKIKKYTIYSPFTFYMGAMYQYYFKTD
jgi:hypothetical protein